MRRSGKYKVKEERSEPSASVSDIQDRDLTYFIHDRVELMHQVFSVLKAKELKAMAPHCVQHISLSDLQELCTEELLGISSKRLCAILDGAEPPSDTETSSASSPERFETISLDSISSDEEILSQDGGKKKKHKHCRHKSRGKQKARSSSEASDNADKSKASRAGLTVLELLELQARARAIRAQLQQEQTADVTENKAPATVQQVSDDEVEIKEEPAEVVEISSEDEKPKIEEIEKEMAQTSKKPTKETIRETQSVTRKINDLIITVPQTKHTRKIKLIRNTPATSKTTAESKTTTTNISVVANKNKLVLESSVDKTKNQNTEEKTENKTQNAAQTQKVTTKEKQKKKSKKKEKKGKNKEGSDHDEITLQLSDSEKMDLLENLDRKNYDIVSSSSSEDSESSEEETETKDKSTEGRKQNSENISNNKEKSRSPSKSDKEMNKESDIKKTSSGKDAERKTIAKNICIAKQKTIENHPESILGNQSESIPSTQKTTTIINTNNDKAVLDVTENMKKSSINEKNDKPDEGSLKKSDTDTNTVEQDEDTIKDGNKNNPEKSDGEISDRESSEVEVSDVRPEVVCISDDEVNNKKTHKRKKNKKKEKKSKKEKKTKDGQDFRNGSDQNFYKEPDTSDTVNLIDVTLEAVAHHDSCVDNDVYEILELSDESSCNEEDGSSVLSKEPTAEEIEALSAKIDEIERENVVTEDEIREHERAEAAKEVAEAEGISWKDRYLDSKKVKNVLTTSNILNAMRKKNKELKRKLEESKKEIVQIAEEEVPDKVESNLEEGSIEQYNTLEASTKYVDPVKDSEVVTPSDNKVTKEMKKDAKQLLKMYKKLLKYNDITRQKDPNRKKKKKQKKNKEDKNRTEGDTETKVSS